MAEDLVPGEINALILNARPTLKDANGWAADLADVMQAQSIPAARENVCAAIAVIDQESNFNANPVVPGLGKLAEGALRAKFDRLPYLSGLAMDWLDTHPKGQPSYLQRLRAARTERDLDLTYRAFVNDFSTVSNLSLVVQSGLLNRLIEERNNISTIGAMQVSVHYALEEVRQNRFLPMTLSDDYALRDELYTRRGGLYYGVRRLLGYDSGYSKKIYRFADFNAGIYSSRNAAFQNAINNLMKKNLTQDGDLLTYDKKGEALETVSGTEKALRAILATGDQALSDVQIRTDLLLEKKNTFAKSQTYLAVKNLYQRKFGKPAPFAIIPSIDLSSPKLRQKMTTASYADSVNKRYLKCMAYH